MTDKLFISKRPYPKGEDGYRTFSVRVKEEIVADLENIAKQTGRSRNELINFFLEFALDNAEIEE